MQKIQILFSEPILVQLRTLAQEQDRSVSEIVRVVVENWLGKCSFSLEGKKMEIKVPTFTGGKVLVSSDKLRGTIYSEDE